MASPPGPVPLPPHIETITSSQLIGTLLNFFLFGTLFIQVYVYNLCFPKDMLAIKLLVYFVFLTMLVCTCLNAADAYYWFAAGFGDIVKFGQARFSPFYTPLMGSIIALVVQLFFCYRISVFRAGASWWSGVIAAVSFLQAAGGIGGGVKAFIASNEQHDEVRTVLVYLWLVGDAVADIMIAVTMTYLLTKASEPETRDIVRGVVRLIIETNSFSASVAIIGLALFAGMPTSDYFICPTMILPGLYANTLLVLLNNRAAPSRQRLPSDNVHSSENHIFNSGATSTINGTSSLPWKVSSPPPMTPQIGKFDSFPRPRYSDDIPIGPFVAAPNPLEDRRPARSPVLLSPVDNNSTRRNQQHLVSGWDDASYTVSVRDGSARWEDGDDTKSFDLADVENHPYGSQGTYVSWAR
ncbi:hypothetical protein R3P38DRAFT_2607109 [Favolaschia claudopus]|uniref:DUF6534 domain-containing protein n=1 Tax=Favolaschia claudopus TaxID=2862362 RepID=A0AAW0D119_9AGAR